MALLSKEHSNHERGPMYRWYCPGCKHCHVFDKRWTFDGNLEKPTFHPSFLVTGEYGEAREKVICHSYVRSGQIQFLTDCTHDLAGQTVDLVDLEET